MSTKVGDIFVRANLDDSQYKKGLTGLDKFSGGIAKSITRKLSLAGAVAGLGAFVKKATEAGASLNAVGTIIDASLPHMTQQVDAFAKSAGAMFGLSETQAKGFVGKYASMASAMGYTEQQAYNMSTALTGLAGDVASYYHLSADDAYAKLGAIFTGETESLKQLGVVMTQTALDAFALEHGFGKTTQQMTELEKTTLRYQFVMDRLKLASGDFSKYATTWSGSLATIRLNWSNFMATMGQGIINILLPLLQVIAKVSNALTALGSRFLAFTKRLMGIKDAGAQAFGKQTQKDLQSAGAGVENVGAGLGSTGKNAKSAKKEVKALKRELLGFDRITKLSDAGTTTGGTGTSGGGGGISGGGISAGGVDFTQADADVASFSERAKDYLSSIELPAPLKNALNDLKDAFGGLFDTLSKAGKWAYDNVLAPLGEWTINEVAPVAVEILANAIDLVNGFLKLLGEILEPLWKPIIKPFFEFLGGVAVDSMKLAGDALGILADIFNKASDGVALFKEKFEDVKNKWDEFKVTKKELVVGIADKFSGTWKKIRDSWDSVKKKFKGGKATVTLTLVNKFSKAWNKVKKAWNSIKSKSAKITLSFTDKLKSGYNAIAKKIQSARKKYPATKAILPDIHPLAQGGYVKANTPQLAMIGDNRHEGEIVAPESKLRAMAQEASQGGNAEVIRLLSALLTAVQTKDNNVYLDGEKIKNNVVRRINNHTRATGQLEIIV